MHAVKLTGMPEQTAVDGLALIMMEGDKAGFTITVTDAVAVQLFAYVAKTL